MSNMKDCFFCGATAAEVKVSEKKILESGNTEGIRGAFLIQCTNCGNYIEHDDLDSLERMWNYLRKPPED